MNADLAQYVITCIHNSHYCPTPDSIRTYLIEPCERLDSRPKIYYRMMATLEEAIRENRALDAYNIFNLIWWDMNVFFAQHVFRLVQDMEVDPDDDLSGYTAIQLSHTIIGKFPTLT